MKSLLKLRHLVRPYWLQILGAFLTLLGVTASRLIVPSIIRQVIDTGLGQGEIDFILRAAGMVLGVGALAALFGFGQRYLSEYISMRVAFDLRNRLYNHIQRMSFSFHDRAQTGQLMSRCTEDVSAIQNFVGFGIIELIQIMMLMIGTVGLMLAENLRLASIGLLPIIPLILVTTHFGSRISKLFYAVDKAVGELSSRLQENVSGAQVVRAFAREPFEIDRFDQSNRELYHARVTVIAEWSKIMPTTNLLVSLSTILILWYGGQMALAGEMTIGQIVAFNSYLLLLALPAQQLTWFVNSAGEAAAGLRRVFEILDDPPKIISPTEALKLPTLRGKVEFKNVTFAYVGENKSALYDINLSVEPNQVIALTGATGSGKTTLVNLIPRFYDTTQGAVLVDGQDVRQVDIPSLRCQIGIVLQTSLLFSATIRENIAFGKPDASEEEIVQAALSAQAHEFITSFPEGYDTVVGERGVTLSGGQRQRVAIARALLINPRILILDDSTSSVDIETEHLIQKALDTLMQGRTTFVIAQRVSTVRRADLILVMDEGRIAEQGTHEQLLTENGLYRQIYDLQLQAQEDYTNNSQQAKPQ
ncbi:MAG: ABC transporter ATP-binding protein/permease [Anaerolineae bacterium]|nr:ABC transporter ATP-binding protein/permease [Anaerolineae bacterium]